MSAIAYETRLQQLQSDVDACGPDARALFAKLLGEGKTPEAAAMYACQQAACTLNSDRSFSEGQHKKMERMSPLVRGMLQSRAKAAGIDTRGKYYIGGPFGAHDPRSWATCAEDVLTIAKRNNLNVDGRLNQEADRTEPLPKEKPAVAPDIVNELARKKMKADPALAERCRKSKHALRELRESITEKHARKKHKRTSRLRLPSRG